MAGTKEIRSKIKSIKNTQKITKAMEMVAASKMRKVQERMQGSRPYAERIKTVINHLASGRLEYQHPYLIEREAKNIGFIIISTDRGLCGGLNANLLKSTVQAMREWNKKGADLHICTVGKKAESFFRRFGGNVIASISGLSDKPGIMDVIGIVKIILELYDTGKLDRIFLAYNKFVNTMTQQPVIDLILPINAQEQEVEQEQKQGSEKIKYAWDYIYEPEAKTLLDALLIRYVESLAYQSVVENIACEQAARMVAMKNASDNAGELIDDLQLMYNKARQASITREISEIVAGAAAV